MFDSTVVRFWCLGCGNDLVFAHSRGWYLDAEGSDSCPVEEQGDPVYSHVAAASTILVEADAWPHKANCACAICHSDGVGAWSA